ncbi:hypothetical protein NKH77_18460 [Streptomyces sp. M19]
MAAADGTAAGAQPGPGGPDAVRAARQAAGVRAALALAPGCWRSAPRTRATRSPPRRPGRCTPGSPRTRWAAAEPGLGGGRAAAGPSGARHRLAAAARWQRDPGRGAGRRHRRARRVFHTGRRIRDLAEVGHADTVFLDTGPKEFLALAGDRLPVQYGTQLRRFRYGPAAAKVDFLVSEPVPWTDPEVGRAGTVHIGGTRAQVFRRETLTARGRAVDEPFVLLVDPAVADPGGPAPASARCGRTRTCRTGRTPTRCRWSPPVSSGTRRGSPTPWSRRGASAAGTSRCTTRTTWAGTSSPGRPR